MSFLPAYIFFSLIPSFPVFTPSKRTQKHQSYFLIVIVRRSLYTYVYIYSYLPRSSHLYIFFKIGILENFGNFTGKDLCWTHFIKERLQKSVKFAKFIRTPISTSSGYFCLHFAPTLTCLYLLTLTYLLFIDSYFICSLFDIIWTWQNW